MTDFKIQLEAQTSNPEPSSPWNRNILSDKVASGVLIADITDDTGAATGWTFTAVTPCAGAALSTAAADNAADRPLEVLRTTWFTSNGGTSVYQIGDLTVGDSYSVFLGGNNGNNRDTQYTVNGVTADYIDGTAAAPTNSTQFDGTVPAGGIIEIEVTKSAGAGGQFYGYLDSVRATITAGGPSESITPDNMTDGESAVALNPVGLGTITSWTINGIPTTGTDTTIDNLDILSLASVSGVITPTLGDVTIEVEDIDGKTASATANNGPKAGYTVMSLATVDESTPASIYDLADKQLGVIAETDDAVYYQSSLGSIDSSGNWEFNSLGNNVVFIKGSTAYLLTIDNAITESAEVDVVIQPKTGWARVVLAGTLDKSTDEDGRKGFLKSVDDVFGVVTEVGNIVYYNNERGEEISADGAYTGGTTSPYEFTEFVIQQGGSSKTTAASRGGAFYPYGVTSTNLEEEDIIISKLKVSSIVGVRIKATKIKAVKL